ncbi:MAG: ferrochelatase [Alphaproteobacteria bacterium]|nr:ferrochelatase [Alphaproteobacteria bacterium]
MHNQKHGVLLINLGSPANPSPQAVKAYLDQFLMDPYVITLPYLLRCLLVKGIILNTRPKKSAANYQKIWTDQGSPLVAITQTLTNAVQHQVNVPVYMAMRYGEPSIQQSLTRLIEEDQCSHIHAIALYPQYAESTTLTAKTEVERIIHTFYPTVHISFKAPFYNDPHYLEAMTESSKHYFDEPYDHVLFSFHGLPVQHLVKADPSHAHCLKQANCCDMPNIAHETCYRHQSLATVKSLVANLGIPPHKYSTAFQSRLGKAKWLEPYTSETIKQLANNGIKRLLVMCPAFVADCLETIEEMGMQNRDIFIEHGGKELVLIPCLNDHPSWVKTITGWIQHIEK